MKLVDGAQVEYSILSTPYVYLKMGCQTACLEKAHALAEAESSDYSAALATAYELDWKVFVQRKYWLALCQKLCSQVVDSVVGSMVVAGVARLWFQEG